MFRGQNNIPWNALNAFVNKQRVFVYKRRGVANYWKAEVITFADLCRANSRTNTIIDI